MSDHIDIERIEEMLTDFENAVHTWHQQEKHVVFDDLPGDVRYRLLALACSVNDYVIWIQRDPPGWEALEVETGVHGRPADTPQKAMDNYWRGLT